MKRKLIILASITVFFIAIVFLSPLSLLITGANLRVHNKFNTIVLGQNQSEVVSLLGQPQLTEHKPINQIQGIRTVRAIGNLKESVSYSVWQNGYVVVYIIGYSQDKKVVATLYGKI